MKKLTLGLNLVVWVKFGEEDREELPTLSQRQRGVFLPRPAHSTRPSGSVGDCHCDLYTETPYGVWGPDSG